jgi:hypothetical protein
LNDPNTIKIEEEIRIRIRYKRKGLCKLSEPLHLVTVTSVMEKKFIYYHFKLSTVR